MKWTIIWIFVLSTVFVHFRGRVRLRPFRQITDHSTFLAPVNVLLYGASTVPNQPYLDASYFPEMKIFDDNWEKIREEGLRMVDQGLIKASDTYNDVGFNSFFRTGWKRFYLKWYDTAHPSAEELCPFTVGLLKQVPNVKAAMFTHLPPGARLVRHRDPYAGSIRYHLGLSTPNDDRCFIEVDGERYSWRDGQSVFFDETYIHYAENQSGQNRLILFCDIERPMRYRWAQWVNHWLGRNLMSAAAAPNDEGDRTGGVNRMFKYIYAVRKVGKRLKAWNRRIYYLIKWILFGGIAALIFYAL